MYLMVTGIQTRRNRALSTKPRISLNEDNLIWEPLISKEPQISVKNDEVYNVLFYDDALDQNSLNKSMKNGIQLPGKLKKKRRRRSTVNNHDESSCDKPMTLVNGHHHHLRNTNSSATAAAAAIVTEDSNSSPLFKVRRRKRSTSRSPFKRLKLDTSSLSTPTMAKMSSPLTNGNHKTINGKLPVRNLSNLCGDEINDVGDDNEDHHQDGESSSDSNSNVSNSKNENRTSSTTLITMKQQHSSPLRNHHHSPRNLSNGVC
ncbi:hypothetical protein HUG17_9073 [Dermatophagoides farinae]|uniref:Uncharacterized protein n=1 Tax=Dermatophagoides farinae TaxID=6954 RepID=A0A9D4NTI0_DERFA|nr:hypothetical protein HUG17_9073 [Dermatophagoides farinae]